MLDYYVPIWGVKKFGGTSYGTWGSTIGLCVGFFVIPAVGIFLGAFLGAMIGELIGGMETTKALKAAIGSFLGFLAGIFMKVILCLAMIGVAGYQLGQHFFWFLSSFHIFPTVSVVILQKIADYIAIPSDLLSASSNGMANEN